MPAKFRTNNPVQACPVCRTLFIPSRKGTLYCCDKCKVAAFRVREKEQIAAELARLNDPQLALPLETDQNKLSKADRRMLKGGTL